MSVLKVIEVLSESEESWEAATATAIAKASKSLDGISSAWVKDQSVTVKDGKVDKYRVALKVTFEVK